MMLMPVMVLMGFQCRAVMIQLCSSYLGGEVSGIDDAMSAEQVTS